MHQEDSNCTSYALKKNMTSTTNTAGALDVATKQPVSTDKEKSPSTPEKPEQPLDNSTSPGKLGLIHVLPANGGRPVPLLPDVNAIAEAVTDEENLMGKCSFLPQRILPDNPTSADFQPVVGAIAVSSGPEQAFPRSPPTSPNDYIAHTAAVSVADKENLVEAHLVEETEPPAKKWLTPKNIFFLLVVISAVLLTIFLTSRSGDNSDVTPSDSKNEYMDMLRIGSMHGSPGDQFGKLLPISSGGISVASGGNGFVQVFQPTMGTETTIQLSDLHGMADGPVPELLDIVLSGRGSRLVVGVARTLPASRANVTNALPLLEAGQVLIFDLAPDRRSWNQLLPSLGGIVAEDRFGSTLALSSDGRIVAASSPNNNDSPGSLSIFRECGWCDTGWEQLGRTLVGQESQDQFSFSTALSSSGMRLVVGAQQSDSGPGYVQVFDYNGTEWSQVGQTILGESHYENFGGSVSLSSGGSILACAARKANNNTGLVRIFHLEEFSNDTGPVYTWKELGGSLFGSAEGDEFGVSVTVSEGGERIVVGASQGLTGSGYVRIFNFDSSEKIWSQTGRDLRGTVVNEKFGFSNGLSADGFTLSVGAIGSGADGDNSGKVQVFDLTNL